MWTYRQRTGELITPNGEVMSVGYSGAPPDGFNNPGLERVHDVGPIPAGEWTIGEPFFSETHGPFCLPLTPALGTETHGRSGFLMHGDSIEHPGGASHGCIIMRRSVREGVWASGDRGLLVVGDLAQGIA